MAAPIEAYRNKSLWMRGGTTNYEHKVAILQVNKATMLARFYLDDLVVAKVDGTNDGVIGVVIIGGENEKMHNIATRGGVGRARVNGQTARLLNDAGLNTLGMTSQPTTITNPTIVDLPIDEFTSKSAFYSGGSFGVSISLDSGSTWSDFEMGFHTQDTIELSGEINLGEVPGLPLKATDTVLLRTYHENEEGRKYSDTTPAYINAWLIPNMRYAGISSWPSQAIQVYGDIYALEKTYLGGTPYPAGKLSNNPDGTSLVDSEGWFVNDDIWIKYTGASPSQYEIVDFGPATPAGWPPGDPAYNPYPPSFTSPYVYYTTTPSTVCTTSTSVVGNLYAPTGVTPVRYYTNQMLSLTASGYYQFLDGRPGRGNPWVYLVDGYVITEGVCDYVDPN